jgi:hypothetical protein
MRMTTITVARCAVAGVIAGALLALTGCANAPVSGPPAAATSSTTTTSSAGADAALCAAATDFQTAANELVDLNAVAVGVDGVKAALENLRTAATDLANAAKAEFAPQVDALGQAVDSLRTTIGGLQDQAGLSAKLGAIATSVSGVERAAAPIVESARARCPSVPPAVLPTQAPATSSPPST